jgi:hypothetical protein
VRHLLQFRQCIVNDSFVVFLARFRYDCELFSQELGVFVFLGGFPFAAPRFGFCDERLQGFDEAP